MLRLFNAGHTLTLLTSIHYGISSLTSRVAELRKAGFQIISEWKKDAQEQRYKAYHMPADKRDRF